MRPGSVSARKVSEFWVVKEEKEVYRPWDSRRRYRSLRLTFSIFMASTISRVCRLSSSNQVMRALDRKKVTIMTPHTAPSNGSAQTNSCERRLGGLSCAARPTTV